MDYLYVVTIEKTSDQLDMSAIDQAAIEQFSSLGKLDFSLNEATVDELLGKEAYCGGDIPENLLHKIEEAMEQNQKPSYFWEDLSQASAFKAFVEKSGSLAELTKEEKSDWNESWRKGFKEIIVSEDLKVVPSWQITEDKKEHIYIYPGMGFGTGNHETTFLCLKLFTQIQNELKEGCRCLDFGCGSGILGIAPLKNLKSVVDFVDIDKDALDNCVANLEYNQYASYSEGHGVILRERFKSEETYPLVFANILENVLESECDVITRATQDNGYLIVSGLLDGQQQNIINTYSKFSCLEVLKKGDWVAILFKKEKDA